MSDPELMDDLDAVLQNDDSTHSRLGGCLFLAAFFVVGTIAVSVYDIPYVDDVVESEFVTKMADKVRGTEAEDDVDEVIEFSEAPDDEPAAHEVVGDEPPPETPEEYEGPTSAYLEEGFDPDHVEFDFGGASSADDGDKLPRVLSAHQIQTIVDTHRDELVDCYSNELDTNPDLAGRVDLDFAVTPDGQVAMVRVVDSTLESTAAEDCFVERARHWRFPETNHELPTRFETDFTFSN